MIKTICLVIAISISTHYASSQTIATACATGAHEHAWSKCTGAANCKACRNCSKCAHCNAGGSCGVCARTKHEKPSQKIEQKKQSLKTRQQPNDRATSGHQDYHLKKVELRVKKADLLKGPALDLPVIAILYPGQKLLCLSKIGNWVKVRTDKGLVGFVQSDAIKISSYQ